MLRSLRLVAAALVVAATGLCALGVTTAPPAGAATCAASTGVTVIVDFNQLGGGVQGDCVAGGGGHYADTLFPDAGFPLRYASRQPGFVCRVSGVPASDPCVNTAPEDRYWSLWWSTGEPGASWVYASLGAGSLKIPDGGRVALSWDAVDGKAAPSAPAGRTAPSTPSSTPTTSSHPSSSAHPSQPGASTGAPQTTAPDATGGPSSTVPPADPSDDVTDDATDGATDGAADGATATSRPHRRHHGSASRGTSFTSRATSVGTPYPDIADPAPPRRDDAANGGLPGWVPPLVIVVLFLGAGGAVALRRRRAG